MKDLSDSFKQLRKEEAVTQQELSEITGIKIDTIKSIESGKQKSMTFDHFHMLYNCPRTKKYAEQLLNVND